MKGVWDPATWRPRRVWPFVTVALALLALLLLWEVLEG